MFIVLCDSLFYVRDAWNRLGTMERERAMLYYVDELKKVEM